MLLAGAVRSVGDVWVMCAKSVWYHLISRRRLRARTRIDLDQRSEEGNIMHPVLADYEVRAFVSHRQRKMAELERHQYAAATASAVPAATPRNAPAGTAGHAMSLISWFFMRASHGFQGSAH